MEKPASQTLSHHHYHHHHKLNQQQRTKKQHRKESSPISHYESQGWKTKEASIKVIDDLQNKLFRVVTSGRGKKERIMADTSRKKNVHTRLAVLESKVDSKPGYRESLAIGVAAGAVLKGVGVALLHVFGAVEEIWNAVRNTTKLSSSSS